VKIIFVIAPRISERALFCFRVPRLRQPVRFCFPPHHSTNALNLHFTTPRYHEDKADEKLEKLGNKAVLYGYHGAMD
jgi:hypothetical protein